VIIKPAMGDGGFGITKENVVNSFEEFINVISNLRGNLGYDKPILIEEFLTGKDLTFEIIMTIRFPILKVPSSSLKGSDVEITVGLIGDLIRTGTQGYLK